MTLLQSGLPYDESHSESHTKSTGLWQHLIIKKNLQKNTTSKKKEKLPSSWINLLHKMSKKNLYSMIFTCFYFHI